VQLIDLLIFIIKGTFNIILIITFALKTFLWVSRSFFKLNLFQISLIFAEFCAFLTLLFKQVWSFLINLFFIALSFWLFLYAHQIPNLHHPPNIINHLAVLNELFNLNLYCLFHCSLILNLTATVWFLSIFKAHNFHHFFQQMAINVVEVLFQANKLELVEEDWH